MNDRITRIETDARAHAPTTGTDNRLMTEQRRNRPPNDTNRLQQQGPRDQPPFSHNPDFTGIVKALHKLVQLQLHAESWEEDIPQPIRRDLNDFIDYITPADPTDDIKDRLAAILVGAGYEMQIEVQNHYEERLEVHRNFLKRANPLDKDWAMTIALGQLKYRFGRKLSTSAITATLQEEARHIGLHRRGGEPVETASPSPSQPPAKKRNLQHTPPSANANRTQQGAENQREQITRGEVENMTGDFETNGEEEDIPCAQQEPEPELETPAQNQPRNTKKPTTRTRKTIHGPHAKHFWKVDLRPDTTTLVISDSNLARVEEEDIPQEWQLEVFSGAQFRHAAKLLQLLPRDNPTHIITSIGLNHRDWDFTKSTYRETHRIHEANRDRQGYLHAVGVAHSTSLTSPEKDNLQLINNRLKQIYGGHFVNPLSPDAVQTERDGIHHNQETTKMVWQSLLTHINTIEKN